MTSAIFREMEQIGRDLRYGAVVAGKVESMALSSKRVANLIAAAIVASLVALIVLDGKLFLVIVGGLFITTMISIMIDVFVELFISLSDLVEAVIVRCRGLRP